MNLEKLVNQIPVEFNPVLNLSHVRDLEKFRKAVIKVMNASGVATGRGTHYNTSEEELKAREDACKALFEMDRGVFLLVHALEGVTDHARKTAIKAMLMNSWERYQSSSLDRETETNAIFNLVSQLPANRALNLMNELRVDRVNNSRTKKRLMLPFLLNHPNLAWWAVKYRKKVRRVLEHAWGKQATGAIKATIGGSSTLKEQNELKARIDRYLTGRTDPRMVYECISFVLGGEEDYKIPLFKAFKEAKVDIRMGRVLPLEVLEGIRSTYHKTVTQKEMLELTRNTSMTEKKKALVQRKAKKENVFVAFNPMARSAPELYILAYAQGMTDAIWQALMKKGRQGAAALPVRFGKIGILVDDSFSMTGTDTQKLRPMAVALSMKDVLVHTGEVSVVRTASGRTLSHVQPLIKPLGDTDLSLALVDLLENRVDAVFILTDGYENAPSGRVDEVMRLLQRIGNSTPVYQLGPAFAGESQSGLKTLSERIPAIPVSNPQALALTLTCAMIEVDVRRGIQAMANLALPRINKLALN